MSSTETLTPDGASAWRTDIPVVIWSTATQAVFTDQISAEYEVQLAAVERDCLLSIDVAYESLRAIWTGTELGIKVF